MGRGSGVPVPEIILGAIGIKPNHAHIAVNEKTGLFEIVAFDAEAALNVLINGKPLPAKKRSRCLNHLDRIGLPGGVIYLFHYPLLAKAIRTQVEEHAEENAGVDLDLQLAQAWSELSSAGIPNFDKEAMALAGWTDEELPGWD